VLLALVSKTWLCVQANEESALGNQSSLPAQQATPLTEAGCKHVVVAAAAVVGQSERRCFCARNTNQHNGVQSSQDTLLSDQSS
jgi:hypothetical protein